jgi:hypothetical protein
LIGMHSQARKRGQASPKIKQARAVQIPTRVRIASVDRLDCLDSSKAVTLEPVVGCACGSACARHMRIVKREHWSHGIL